MIGIGQDILEKIKSSKNNNSKIVFTNGVFDIIHRGHVEYLKSAASLGDILIVGVNSDSSVKRLKGDDRPVNNQDDRSFIIAELKSVDHVIIFEEDTPEELIRMIKPDILVKGGDYDPDMIYQDHPKYIVGKNIVEEYGGSVRTIQLTPGRSTTGVINKIRR